MATLKELETRSAKQELNSAWKHLVSLGHYQVADLVAIAYKQIPEVK